MILSLLLLVTDWTTNAHAAREFPKGFRWCVATSAHQIEGYNQASDWWAWESTPGNIDRGEISGAAADHWNHLERDTEILQELGADTYRMSIEWAKLEPIEGEINADAIRHYRHELMLLEQAGVQPMITLHHFTLPRWVELKGGLGWSGFPAAFSEFVKQVATQIAPTNSRWVTFNEPMVLVGAGYVQGVFPPGKKEELKSIVPPLLGILRAHAAAYKILHEFVRPRNGEPVRVGVAQHLRTFDAKRSWHVLDRLVAKVASDTWNWAFLEAIRTGTLRFSIPFVLTLDETIAGLKGTQDFIGINYYTGDLTSFQLKAPFHSLEHRPDVPRSELDWDIYPEGLYRVVVETAKRYPRKPIWITENGLADSKDRLRPQFLRDHLTQLHRAIEDGAPVEGYCHWSMIDNFEWAYGFAPRFGLYEVNYSTQARTPRASGRLFSEISRKNGLCGFLTKMSH